MAEIRIKIPKIPKVDVWRILTIALAVIILAQLFGFFSLTGLLGLPATTVSNQKVGEKVINYINQNLVQPGTSASLVSVIDKGSFYEVVTSYQGDRISVYASKDGSYLFLQGFDMNQPTTANQPTPTTQPPRQQEEVDWTLFQTSLPDELKNKILTFTYKQPVQIEDRVQEFKDYSECRGNVIVFYFDWCGWCKRYHPVLVEAKEDYPSLNFYTLDLEKNKDIGDIFGVRGAPATVINCKYLVSGYLPKESLYPMLDKYTK